MTSSLIGAASTSTFCTKAERRVTARRRASNSRVEKVFGQIIISTNFETDNAIRFIATSGQHEHGHVGFFADVLQYFEAVHAWQHQVQDQGMPRFGHRALHTFRACMHGLNLVAKRAESSP